MIVIFRGPSGSGKSTLAKLLMTDTFELPGGIPTYSTPATDYVKSLWGSIIASQAIGVYASADDYFMVNGEYKFDPKYLNAAHGGCLQKYTDAVKLKDVHVIVDNTNCSLAEVAPYAALASAYGQEIHIITMLVPAELCWQRNKHKVPFANIAKQEINLRQSIAEWPPWFPQQIFPN